MISNIEKQIRERLGTRFGLSGRKMSFLKYSTPISGSGLGNKVIFFVFDGLSDRPSVIVKTVRTKRDAEVIRSGHRRLKELNAFTAESRFHAMFPEALIIYDDGNLIWSAETACAGRIASRKRDSELVLSEYAGFAGHMSSKIKERLILGADYGDRIIDLLSGQKETIEKLRDYNAKLWDGGHIDLPKIPQHGDLTIDNVLVDNEGIRIVDCDIFGDVCLPGYDVFHFLTRAGLMNRGKRLADFLKATKIDHVPDKRLFFTYFLHDLLVKRDYILAGQDARSVIDRFENMVLSF